MILLAAALLLQDAPWTRHVIDDTSKGADGVRLGDVDGDGRPDIVTGWEEGGVIRVYRNPGPKESKGAWPQVTVGRVKSPEDAVFADIDGDGFLDVVSSCEGDTRTVYAHKAPKDKARYFDPDAWTTEPLPVSKDRMMWMYSLPMQVDGRRGVDLVAGGKGKGAALGWFESPESPMDLKAWTWHEVSTLGWVMSIVAHDVDRDGDMDLVLSDRKGPDRGVRWLENPGWASRYMGGKGLEVMFLTLEGDDVYAAVREGPILHLKRKGAALDWETIEIPMPGKSGTGKSVRVADLDQDGKKDLVVSCESAEGEKSGVFRLLPGPDSRWIRGEVSGPAGTKFDLIELLDLDGDGDLDVITCEERENLGVIWYENPLK